MGGDRALELGYAGDVPDLGLTHLALAVTNLEQSVAFYETWTDLKIVHKRSGVAWMSDGTRSFALVLAEDDVPHPLAPFSHLGFAVESTERVHELAERAREEGILQSGPNESGPPVGTWCFIRDPDGHMVEFSFGQEVEQSVYASVRQQWSRLKAVAVIGSGTERHQELALPLGQALAEMNVDLVCGGGGGVMEAVAEGFVSVTHRAGRVTGILPAGDLPGYPNKFIEFVVRTHLPARGSEGSAADSRNHLVVLTGDVIVALPGGAGTASERELATRYGRPLVEIRFPSDIEGLRGILGQLLGI